MHLGKIHIPSTTDPKKIPGTSEDNRESSRVGVVKSDSAAYVSNLGMTESKQPGNIAFYGDINSTLTPKQEANIMGSKFGQTYLQGEGTLSEKYARYTNKVNNFINNNPAEALTRAKEMATKNDNFKTKLKNEDGSWKSDEQILKITRNMMTDGKIGDFHGVLLSERIVTPKAGFLTPDTANIRSGPKSDLMISSGNRTINAESRVAWEKFAKEKGLDLTVENEENHKALNEFMDIHGSQQTAPIGSDARGTNRGAFQQSYIDEAEENATAHLKKRDTQAQTEAQKNWDLMFPEKARIRDEELAKNKPAQDAYDAEKKVLQDAVDAVGGQGGPELRALTTFPSFRDYKADYFAKEEQSKKDRELQIKGKSPIEIWAMDRNTARPSGLSARELTAWNEKYAIENPKPSELALIKNPRQRIQANF